MRRRSMTNGNGGLQTQAPDLPLNGSGAPPQSGPLAVGPGQAGPGAFGDPAQGGLPVPLSQARRNPAVTSGSAGSGGGRKGSPFSISNWRVRWRLVAIIAVPTITALILGVIQIVGSVNNYESFKRVQTLANLNALVVTATGQIADERDATVGYVASGRTNATLKQTAINDQNLTTATTSQIATDAAAVINGSGYRAQTVIDLNGVLADISDLPNIRKAALSTLTPALSIIQNYDLRLLQPFMAFSDDVAAGTGNATLQSDVTVLNALLHMEDDASLQRAYLYQALESTPAALTPTALSDLNQASSQQAADAAQFDAVASVGEQQTLNNVVSGQNVDESESAEELAIATANSSTLQIGAQQSCTTGTAADCWWTTKSAQITDMRDVSNGPNGLVEQIQAQANLLAQSALRSADTDSVATLLLLAPGPADHHLRGPLDDPPAGKLRADALKVAGAKLPDMVRRPSQSEGGDASAEIEPIGVNSTDQTAKWRGPSTRSTLEAVRLAADEAMLLGNLTRCRQPVAPQPVPDERQLSLIDNLEQTEQDADWLSSLSGWTTGHCMRRTSKNLLVLAGHEAAEPGARASRSRWSTCSAPRSPRSSSTSARRSTFSRHPGHRPGRQRRGPPAGRHRGERDHLLAEDTQVYVTGQPLTSGGVLLDITDNGVGISEQEMAPATGGSTTRRGRRRRLPPAWACRGRPSARQAWGQGPAAVRPVRRPDRADLAPRVGRGPRVGSAAQPAAHVRGRRLWPRALAVRADCRHQPQPARSRPLGGPRAPAGPDGPSVSGGSGGLGSAPATAARIRGSAAAAPTAPKRRQRQRRLQRLRRRRQGAATGQAMLPNSATRTAAASAPAPGRP